MFTTQVQLFKQNMHLKAYSKSIINLALLGTKFESVLPLFNSSNRIVFSSEPNTKKLLKIAKKIPQMVVLAGIVEGRLLSRTELTKYADLPPLDVVRSHLASTLQQAGGSSLVTLLQANQSQLAASLDAYSCNKNECSVAETSNTEP